MNSIVYNFILKVYHTAKTIFENSFLNAIRMNFNKLALKLGDKSAVVSFLKKDSGLSDCVRNSAVARFIVFVCVKILSFFKKQWI